MKISVSALILLLSSLFFVCTLYTAYLEEGVSNHDGSFRADFKAFQLKGNLLIFTSQN